MKLSKEVRGVIRKIKKRKVDLTELKIYDILMLLCINTTCNGNCKDCILRNEDNFKKYLVKEGIINESNID